MKRITNILLVVIAVMTFGFFSSCADKYVEVTELDLIRCLEPMNLSAKIKNGDQVTFNWDVIKGADLYALELYSNAEMTTKVGSYSLKDTQVPFTVKLEADSKYYFRVQSQTSLEGIEFSKWSVYGKAVETYAVKSLLNLEVTARAENSLSLKWDIDPEVTHITCGVEGGEGVETTNLTADEIAAGAATIGNLAASTNYIVTLYFKSANRGELNLWTRPSTTGATQVNSTAAIQQAFIDKATKVYVKASDTVYKVGQVDVAAGISVYGEELADGTRPVLQGEFHITKDFTGSIYFESVELNGNNPSGTAYGFPMQLKNGGGATDAIVIGSIIYKNCTITGYTKGLMYEWSQKMNIDKLTFDGCDINNVNSDGSVGGDGIDLRQSSNIGTVTLQNNTITQGFRTFFRLDNKEDRTVTSIVVKNNTFMKIGFIDNSNNKGLFSVKMKPTGDYIIANNLFLYETGKAALIAATTDNLTAEQAGIAFSNNYFYALNSGFWTASCTKAQAISGGGDTLNVEPCYNAEAGNFNLTNTDLVVKRVGAPKWFTPYVEHPEDLTLTVITQAKAWDFSDAKYFKGAIAKSRVRDNLLMRVDTKPMSVDNSIMVFSDAATVSKKGIPTDCNLEFKVNQPGSVYLRPVDVNEVKGNHIIVAVDGVIKGGAAANEDMTSNQKILISDIVPGQESTVYIYATGPIGIASLQWSLDVNNDPKYALETPEPIADQNVIKEGKDTSIVITWDAIPNASSYSLIFNDTKYNLTEPTYTIPSTVVKFLGIGGYNVSVYANPGADDIYYKQSGVGSTTFTISGTSGGGDLVVNTVSQLKDAISAGKTSIMLAMSGSPYDLEGTLTINAPVTIKGERDGSKLPVVKGSLKVDGTVAGSVNFKDISFDGTGQGILIEFSSTFVSADKILFNGCTISSFTKSVVYCSTGSNPTLDTLEFNNCYVTTIGNGQGGFDLRKGNYGDVIIKNSTLENGFRELVRIDAASTTLSKFICENNTFYNPSIKAGSGFFRVRTADAAISFKNNIFIKVNTIDVKFFQDAAATASFAISNNFFFLTSAAKFWTGNITEAQGTAEGGAVLLTNPCPQSASGDYFVTDATVKAAQAGDPRWLK